jgi:hypothetical protein
MAFPDMAMRPLKAFGALILLITLSACAGHDIIPTPVQVIPTLAALGPTAMFWDAGLSIKYPADWAAPVYTTAQMLIAPSAAAASRTPPTDLILSLRVGTLADLGATKDTPLPELAAIASGENQTTAEVTRGATTLAGLDAIYLGIQDTTHALYQQTVLARLPDGRVAWLIALAPLDLWADYAPTADQVRLSAALLSANAYPSPDPAALLTARFPPGGMTFNLPHDWIAQSVSDAYLYRAPADLPYQDASGLSNGPQLVIRAQALPAGQDMATALAATLGVKRSALQAILVSTNLPGALYAEHDPNTQQQIIFIGLGTPDGKSLIVLRWTAPAVLSTQTRPILDAIVRSIAFGQPVIAPTSPLKKP